MNFTRPTLITITAPTCSGKTYLLEHLEKLGFNRIVGFTTRDPRPAEKHGVDYYFITREEAIQWDKDGLLAESAEFRGHYYGVTNDEMENKINRTNAAPVVILEPTGVESYETYCALNGFDMFKVFVTTSEKTKIQRLNLRTAEDMRAATMQSTFEYLDKIGQKSVFVKIIATHTDRLLSITSDERSWLTKNTWDAIVPGDDINKALEMIELGIKWRNTRNEEAIK